MPEINESVSVPAEKKSASIKQNLAGVEQRLSKLESEAHDKLQVLDLIELKYMEENEEYLKDFGLSTPNFIQLDKLHEEA